MKIFCWNMNYWENTRGKYDNIVDWKNKCIKYLFEEKSIDFYILQEINPIEVFEKDNQQYNNLLTDYEIIYHELTNELLYDGRKDNFWGNAILFHKKYKLVNKNGLIDFNSVSKNYYGRNGIMAYEFLSEANKKITIINYYNKKNYADRGEYIQKYFDKDNDIIDILENANGGIVLAGDFNTGFTINGKDKYIQFIELYWDKYKVKDGIKNYSDDFIPSSYWRKKGQFYLNDYCFFKNFTNIKLLNYQNDWININNTKYWKGLSDHRSFIYEINFDQIEKDDKLNYSTKETWTVEDEKETQRVYESLKRKAGIQ